MQGLRTCESEMNKRNEESFGCIDLDLFIFDLNYDKLSIFCSS